MIANLQVLRAIAALMVVYQHSYRLLTGHEVRSWEWGGAGVDIFFVISGFIMVYTTQGGTHPMHFARNRLQRIVPLYWLVTLFMFAVVAIMPSLMGSSTADPVDLFKSLFFLPYVKGGSAVAPLLPVGWTLNLEMFFYLVFAVCLCFGRRSVAVCSAFLIALVSLHMFVSGPVFLFMTQPLMLGFVAGMLIAKFRPVLPPILAIAILPLCFAAFIVHVAYLPNVNHGIARLIPAALIVISFLSLEEQGFVIGSRLLLLLGNASYAIYLVHQFVTQGFVIFAPKGGMLGFIFFILAMVCSAAAGVAVYLALEKRITEYFKRRRKAQRTHLSVATS